MNDFGQTICLSMIVKNEAPVIRRCLDSVLPFIDHWIIVDTGSTDGTQEIIRSHLAGVPGKLHEKKWKDFAHNRSEALVLSRQHGDYSFVIDADDTIEYDPALKKIFLSADGYTVNIRDSGLLYPRIQLVKNSIEWKYRGVLHEFMTSDAPHKVEHLDLLMLRNHDGARRRDPTTYQRDAAILQRAVAAESDPFMKRRYTFYLAQSYRDAKQPLEALKYYLLRADMGGWNDEIFYSLYQTGLIKERLGYDSLDVLETFHAATEANPARVEARHAASRYCRFAKLHEKGYEIAKGGLGAAYPAGALFGEPWVYEYGLLDEFAVNAYWARRYGDCLEASLRIIESGKTQGEDRIRIGNNAKAAATALIAEAQPRKLGSRGAETGGVVGTFRTGGPDVPDSDLPRILVAVLAKQKEAALPLYLKCLENLNYPKSKIVLYVRTNNNTDQTKVILNDWIELNRHLYAALEFDHRDVETKVERFGVHEWNPERFSVLAEIRQTSLAKTAEYGCDYYFVADVDNFIRPSTLRSLVQLGLPIVAPLLRAVQKDDPYSNFHAEIDNAGYYKDVDQYYWILNRYVRGIFDLPVVHCTYLIRADVINDLSYIDGSVRHEYVIFSESARKASIPQYLDNRSVYGHVAFDRRSGESAESEFAASARLMKPFFDLDMKKSPAAQKGEGRDGGG